MPSSQLERLAQPFPAAAIRGAPKGKYGSYVPHHVVVQALLATVGPFDLEVGQVFMGQDGSIEGCLVTLTVEIDGRRVSVTEVGDCEQPTNWKTQGARMKDAISDGIKRCSARIDLGLHLWAQDDYFLYDQLHKQNSSPADGAGEHAASGAGAAPSTSSQAGAAPTSKNQLQRVQAKMKQLLADNAKIADRRIAAGLPSLTKDCTAEELDGWEALLAAIEAELTAPFAKVDA